MSFDGHIYPCSHHPNQDTKRFHQPQAFSCALSSKSPTLRQSLFWFLSSCLVLSVLERDLNGRVQHALLFLAPLDTTVMRHIHDVACVTRWFTPTAECSSTVCTCHRLSLLLLMDTWAVSRGWLLWVRLLCTFSHKSACRHVFSLLLGKEKYLGEDQLSQGVGPCLTLWETAELFSKVVSSFPSHQQRGELWFSLSSTALSTISLFIFSYPSGYEVTSHILVVFVWTTWWPGCWAPFPVVPDHLHFVFAELSVKVFCLFYCSLPFY